MNQGKIDQAWANDLANSIFDELVRGSVLKEVDWERAESITSQEIFVWLVGGRRPDANYKSPPGPPEWMKT